MMPDCNKDDPIVVPGHGDAKTPPPIIAGTPQPDGTFLTPDGRRLLGNPNDAPPYSQRNRFTTYPGDLEIISPKRTSPGVISRMKQNADESIQLTQEDDEILDGVWARFAQRQKTGPSAQGLSRNLQTIRSCRGDQIRTGNEGAEGRVVIQYIDNEEGYLNWVAQHPDGFLINCYRNETPDYLWLHRTTCGHIKSPKRKNYTTRGFKKVCSDNRKELADWAANEVCGVLNRCRCCKK